MSSAAAGERALTDKEWAEKHRIVCHAPDGVDRCEGCSHYHGRAAACIHAQKIPEGGYPSLEGESVKLALQVTGPAGLPAISLAEAIAIREVYGRLGYPNKYQAQVLDVCSGIIAFCAKSKMDECCRTAALANGASS